MMNAWAITYLSVFSVSFLFSFLTLKSENRSLRLFILLLFLGLLVEGIVNYGELSHRRNLPVVYRIYMPVEYVLIGLLYFYNIKNRFIRTLILISIICFSGIGLLVARTATIKSGFPSLYFNIEGLMVLIIACYHLLSIKGRAEESIFGKPFFWIDVAFLIFYSGNFFLISLLNTFRRINYPRSHVYFVGINTVLNILLYVLFIVEFLCSARARQSSRS